MSPGPAAFWRAAVAALALSAAAGGCAGAAGGAAKEHVADDCPMDWRALGERAGRRGARIGVVEQHLSACPSVDARRARAAFGEGHAVGLSAFCTTAGQYESGRTGAAWRGVCPAEREAELRAAHADGLRVHVQREALARQRARLADIEQYARVGAAQPRDRERFGDPPLPEREALRAAERALHEADARLSRRYGAGALAEQP